MRHGELAGTPGDPDVASALPGVLTAAEQAALVYCQDFPGRTDRVGQVRATLGQALVGYPMAEDAVLAASELAANAVQHSRSREHDGRFIVRAELYPDDYLWLEVEDGGGRWGGQPLADERGRGLAIVDAVASEWGIEGDASARVVRARFDWPRP